MNFIEAICMKKLYLAKIRRKSWGKNSYLVNGNCYKIRKKQEDIIYFLQPEDYRALDWEEYEKSNESLATEIVNSQTEKRENDIKEAKP